MNYSKFIKKNNNKLFKFVERMDAKEFVRIHQDNFKNYYLAEPSILNNDDEIESVMFEYLYDYGFWDTLNEKYTEFFCEMAQQEGIDRVIEWLNNDITEEHVRAILGEDIDNDLIVEEAYEYLNDLSGEYWSNWGPAGLIEDIINIYKSYDKNELRAIEIEDILL
jgi:hypothetical protein